MNWKSSKWGGGDGWNTRAKFRSNYRGWLERGDAGPWGHSLAELGDRLSNAEWGERARIRTVLTGSYQDQSRGVRSAWGADAPARSMSGGWLGGMVDGGLSSLIAGEDGETPPPEATPRPIREHYPGGNAPPLGGLPDESDLDAVRERCVAEVAALALALANNDSDEDLQPAIIARLDLLIGRKYSKLVIEWSGESRRPSEARAFSLIVVEAAMYDQAGDREPLLWKINRFIRKLLNATKAETPLQIRAAPTGD